MKRRDLAAIVAACAVGGIMALWIAINLIDRYAFKGVDPVATDLNSRSERLGRR